MRKVLFTHATRKIQNIAKILPHSLNQLPLKVMTTAGLLAALAGCAHSPTVTFDNLAAAEARQARQIAQKKAKNIAQSRKYYKVKITAEGGQLALPEPQDFNSYNTSISSNNNNDSEEVTNSDNDQSNKLKDS